jgi:hypothetical protein
VKIIETVLHEEGRPPESVFDFVQGITALAVARRIKTPVLNLRGRRKRLPNASSDERMAAPPHARLRG